MAELSEGNGTHDAAAPTWLTALIGALLLAVIATFLLAAPARIPSADAAADSNIIAQDSPVPPA